MNVSSPQEGMRGSKQEWEQDFGTFVGSSKELRDSQEGVKQNRQVT